VIDHLRCAKLAGTDPLSEVCGNEQAIDLENCGFDSNEDR